MNQNEKDIEQRDKIKAEKNALAWQLIVLILISFLVSGAFYGITMVQNPYLKPE